MSILYSVIIFLMASVTMLGGLSFGPFAIGFLFSLIVPNIKKLFFGNKTKFEKTDLLLLAWFFLSCFWSISLAKAFGVFSILYFFFISVILILGLIFRDIIKLDKTQNTALILGCFTSIILFIIEYKTNGVLVTSFRRIFQETDRHFFVLHFLDRGCAILSVLMWPALYIMIKRKNWITSIIFIISVLYLLKHSDSLASFLAVILGLIAAIIICLSRMYMAYIMAGFVVISAFAMPILSYKQEPMELSNNYKEFLPDTAKHRLFIWKYTALKSSEKPIKGWGLGSSRFIPIDEKNDIVYYDHYKWHPLPIHPHNNFMQILLEVGLVGLVLYLFFLVKLILKIVKLAKKNGDIVWGALACGCFITYLFIAMVSFSIWQIWWMSLGAVAIIFLANLAHIKESKNI